MTRFDALIQRAVGSDRRIVFSEGDDPRIVEAAARAAQSDLAHPILLGNQAAIKKQLEPFGSIKCKIECLDPSSLELDDRSSFEEYASAYYDLRRHKGVSLEDAFEAMKDPLNFAAMMVRLGDADGTIGGAVATTSSTVRAALQIIGRAQEDEPVSSFFLLAFDQTQPALPDIFCFADCGLIVEPTVEELAQIAISSADSFEALTNEIPKVAMLSFSTDRSAAHERVDRVVEATALVRSARPNLIIDGELQFDAAIVPQVAAKKAPNSPLCGTANVFVFPNLEAGNIGYKIAQRLGNASAIGPILQGLKKPANDLSRGCSADDVYQMIAVTCIQADLAHQQETHDNVVLSGRGH